MTPRETSQDHRSQFRPFACECLRVGGIAVTMLASVAGQANAQSASSEVAVPEVVVTTEGQKPADGSAESGYRASSATVGPLGKQQLKDLPYSINVTPEQMIENMQATSAAEALRYNPSARPQLGGTLSSNYFMIRGFSVSPYGTAGNVMLDGIRVIELSEPMEDKAGVEVLNGPASFLYGFTGPGGVINYASKRPTETRLNRVTAGTYGGEQGYIHGDFGGPIDGASQFGYRINLVKVNKGDIGVEGASHERELATVALDWKATPDTVVSFDASHFKRAIEGHQAFFLMSNSVTVLPSAPDQTKNYGSPDTFTHDEFNKVGVSIKSKLSDVFAIRSALRYSGYENSSINQRNSFINNKGDYTFVWQVKGENETAAAQGYFFLDSSFDTGPFKHVLTTGISRDHVVVQGSYPTAYPTGAGTYTFPASLRGNILNPTYPAYPAGFTLATGDPKRDTQRTELQSLIFNDRIELTDRWSVLAGVNYASLNDETFNANTGATTNAYDSAKLTPSVATIYKVTPSISAYASYIQSLQQGPTAAAGTANAGEVLKPYLSTQYEVGAKTTFGHMDVNLALFQVEKAAAYTDPATNRYVVDGEQTHKGLEASFRGRLADEVTLGGGLTWLNAVITKNTAALEGKTPMGVPSLVATLYGEYSPNALPGMTMSAGSTYTGKEWVNAANTVSIPEVFLFDLGARYRAEVHGSVVTLRLTVNNVFDTRYWSNKGDTMLYVGNPRTVLASMAVEF